MTTVDQIDLWKAKKPIAVKKSDYREGEFERKILIETDEVVEFRYHYEIHFRTQDDIYCILDEETFYEFFEPYGKIYDSVKYANNCKLKDILEHHLFDHWKFIKNYDKYKEEDLKGENEK